MKRRNFILYFTTILVLSTACQNHTDEFMQATFTVGDEDNAIVLMAGVRNGGTSVTTRAVDPNHGNHTHFKSATKMALRIDGTWLGHSPEAISKSTSATITTTKVKDEHNEVKFEETKCYWDDYGTADPANMNPKTGNGRDKGLTIYAACVEGESPAPNITSWTAQSWNVGTPSLGVIDQTSGWAKMDLLTSNNITSSADGTYKFDEWMNTLGASPAPVPSNILIFTHAMTKMTVELTAGLGFVESKFVGNPTVTLLGFNYTGTVSVEGKNSMPTADATTKILMHLTDGGAGNTTATYDALVFPGNVFENTDDILTLTADGNTYIVTAAKLNEAIQTAITKKATTGYPGTDNSLLQGWNYKLRIIVNQTDIKVEATIVDWKDVKADEEAPKINFSQCYGQDGTNFGKDFTLYRSKNVTGSYITEDNSSTVSYASSKYTMSPQLYWPDHQTHYFFRGVWPVVDSKDTSAEPQQLGPTSSQVKASYVEVANVAYKQGYYPSDLMIGIPRKADGTFDEVCKAGHKTGENATAGICATDAAEGGNHTNNNEGLIHLNFQYVMSKVQFSLKSTGVDGEDKVDLSNVVVEIIDGNKSGKIRLSDGLHENFEQGDRGIYQLHPTTAEQNFDVTTLDAIVPQELSNDVKIRITVTNSNSTTDVYEAQLNKIKDGSSAFITEWKPGNYYKYELDIKKTAIKVTATLKDWVTVTASDNIWF